MKQKFIGENDAHCLLNRDSPPLSTAAEREILAAFHKPRFSRLTAGMPKPAERAGSRHRLWELEAMFHCPVIGTCLSMQELRRLARRADVANVDTFSDYELHSVAVNHAGEKSPFSETMQKWLERKYETDIKRVAGSSNSVEMARFWREQMARGDVAGAYWALVTHPLATPSLIEFVYRDVHMLSHQVGAGQRANLRRQKELADDHARLREKFAEQQAAHAEQTQQMDEMRETALRAEAERDKALAESSGETARAAASALEQATSRLAAVEDQLAQLGSHAAELERRLAEEQARNQQLSTDLRTRSEEADAAEQGLRVLAGTTEDATNTEPTMPDLAGCDLLCVGGRVNLQEHYRNLVERCNGHFNYHDGGIEDGALRLHGLLNSADVVICPADCVSHPVYNEVKRVCKRTGKPCVLLSNSGLGSFTRGLRALAPAKGVTVVPGIISL